MADGWFAGGLTCRCAGEGGSLFSLLLASRDRALLRRIEDLLAGILPRSSRRRCLRAPKVNQINKQISKEMEGQGMTAVNECVCSLPRRRVGRRGDGRERQGGKQSLILLEIG